jgi:hypothetical protein
MHGMRQRQAGQAASDIRDDDHDVGAAAQERERLVGVHGLDDMEAGLGETLVHHHPHEGFVLDAQDDRPTGRRLRGTGTHKLDTAGPRRWLPMPQVERGEEASRRRLASGPDTRRAALAPNHAQDGPPAGRPLDHSLGLRAVVTSPGASAGRGDTRRRPPPEPASRASDRDDPVRFRPVAHIASAAKTVDLVTRPPTSTTIRAKRGYSK